MTAPGDWRQVVRTGGYPVPAHEMRDEENRLRWFEAYLSTYLERDLRQVGDIADVVRFRQFFKAVALRTGNVLNLPDLARDVGLPSTTAQRYLHLLEVSYQAHRLSVRRQPNQAPHQEPQDLRHRRRVHFARGR